MREVGLSKRSGRVSMNEPIGMKLACLIFGLTLLHPTANGAEWALSYGAHDLFVSDKDSHTFGIDLGIAVSAVTDSESRIDGSFTVFANYNKDKLDPDYEPIWYKADLRTQWKLFQLTSDTSVNWLVTADGKLNTVSGIEKQFKFFTGIGAEYVTSTFTFGINTLAGYYFLELDDDIPTVFGYDPSYLQNETAAYTFMADGSLKVNKNMRTSLRIQQWRHESQWLEKQYAVAVSYDLDKWMKGSLLNMSAEHTKYNLSPYQKVASAPVLPWNTDTLLRVYIILPWE